MVLMRENTGWHLLLFMPSWKRENNDPAFGDKVIQKIKSMEKI